MPSLGSLSLSTLADLFVQASSSGKIARTDVHKLTAALDDKSISEEDKSIIERLLHALERGRLKVVNEVSYSSGNKVVTIRSSGGNLIKFPSIEKSKRRTDLTVIPGGRKMINATEVLINVFVTELQTGYRRTYGSLKSDYAEIITWAGTMALENIANSDALYHDVEHTVLVTLVGQEILRGKHIREGGVSCDDWLHFIISLACHDIGYVKGVCHQDEGGFYATGVNDTLINLPPGATDASLTPYHIGRGKLFVEERFGGNKLIDAEEIKRNIELTRFPVPSDEDHQDTLNFPGLVRAADLIGQLSDPRYFQKISALFYEFEETGTNKALGYNSPADLRKNYPKFYWNSVYPYIQDAITYLSLTQQGKQVIANLTSNAFMIEHEQRQEALV